jgi:hypothetical protein
MSNLLLDAARAAPGKCYRVLTPNDGNDCVQVNGTFPRALWIGATAGNLSFQGADGEPVTLPVPALSLVPFEVKRLLATGTTATIIVGIY